MSLQQRRLLRIWNILGGLYNNTKSFLFTSTSSHYFTSDASIQSLINSKVAGASKSWSTSVWLQFSSNGIGTIHSVWDNNGLITVVQAQMYLFYSAGNIKFFVQLFESGTKYLFNVSTTNFSINTWYNITVCYDYTLADAAKIKVYVNGSLDGAACTAAGGYAAPRNTAAMYTIGRLYTGANMFDGLIHQIAFWNRALTAPEAVTLYNGGKSSDFRRVTSCFVFLPALNATFNTVWTWQDLVTKFTFVSTNMTGNEQVNTIP